MVWQWQLAFWVIICGEGYVQTPGDNFPAFSFSFVSEVHFIAYLLFLVVMLLQRSAFLLACSFPLPDLSAVLLQQGSRGSGPL